MLNTVGQKSIYKLLKKYEFEPDHADQVQNLSLLIFDKTQGILHNFSVFERDLLEAGALLHDIGYFVSGIEHNKYSYELITQDVLEGFNFEEREIIGNIARYHRGKKPQKSHSCYAKFDRKTKILIRKLSAISRLADGLDRSHISIVEDLDCVYDSFSQILHILIKLSIPDCSSEIWAAEKKKDMFEKEFKVQVKFRIK
ncbi:MAG: HD domain-containing protein [bacterium]